MKRLFFLLAWLISGAAAIAAPLPVTPYTVIARVDSWEHYRAFGRGGYSLSAPYGSEDTIVATILQPESLAGREIAIPFESKKEGRELLLQRGTIFRFEYHMNLADLRGRTDFVWRRPIEFPRNGILALKANGEVGEAYEGVLTPLNRTASHGSK